MFNSIRATSVVGVLAFAVILAIAGRAAAQMDFGFGAQNDPKLTVTSQFTAPGPNQPARLFVTARIETDWHIYSITQKPGGPVPTEVRLADSDAFGLIGPFQAYPAPETKIEEVFGNMTVESHHGTVTWHAPIRLAEGMDPSSLAIEGELFAQACSESACLPPSSIPFSARLGSGVKIPAEQLGPGNDPPSRPLPPEAAVPPFPPSEEPGAGEAFVTDSPEPKVGDEAGLKWHPYTTMENFAEVVGTKGKRFDPDQISANVKKDNSGKSLLLVLAGAFVGGLLLNLMPCVLPVIGLKVLSFVTQAGENRGRALALNVVYSAGIIFVFLILAALAVAAGLGWGQLFTYAAFNVVMAAVVFAMGLSFLGVWEIPIPGFVGTGKATEIQQREGLSAAFLKGIITTVLATPCTGPFMATALTWALSQSWPVVFSVFLAIGLGMSSPYLLIGAFPGLIRFLPKPGAWMETFKQVMGFFLLGTVVFLLSFLQWPYVVPTVGLLFAIWAGLWWFNRTPVTASTSEKFWAWMEGTAFVGLAWLLLFPGLDGMPLGRLAFHGLHDEMQERFLERVGDGKMAGSVPVPTEPRTVMVDFTADWCLTCKTLEATVLEAPRVRDALEKDGVVLLKADYTHQPEEVTKFLDVLGSRQVPVLAIFSPDEPNAPIVFQGLYSQQDVIDALDKARPRS